MVDRLRRAQRLLTDEAKNGNPLVTRYFQRMYERYPELRNMDDESWRERWQQIAKADTLWLAANIAFDLINQIKDK